MKIYDTSYQQLSFFKKDVVNRFPKKTQIAIVDGAEYLEPSLVYCAPDSWNGDRWKKFLNKDSDDNKKVLITKNSMSNRGILTPFLTIKIRKTFEAKCNGVLTTYPKGGRILVDCHKRRRGVDELLNEGYWWRVPNSKNINLLPVCDMTDVVEFMLGDLTDLLKEGGDKFLDIILTLNDNQDGWKDRSRCVGISSLRSDEGQRKKAEYVIKKFQQHKVGGQNKLTDKTGFYAVFMKKGGLTTAEKNSFDLDFHLNDTSIIDLNFDFAERMKMIFGETTPARMKQPLLQEFFKILDIGIEKKYIKSYDIKEDFGEINGKKIIDKNLKNIENCFFLPKKDDITFIPTYKKYLSCILEYTKKKWIPRLVKEKKQIGSGAMECHDTIRQEIKKIWKYYNDPTKLW